MFGAFGTLMILWAMAGAPRPRGKPVHGRKSGSYLQQFASQ